MAQYETQTPTIQQGAAQGAHDAAGDLVRLSIVGGTVVIIASLLLQEKTVKKIIDKYTR